jgi:hypothetical protein
MVHAKHSRIQKQHRVSGLVHRNLNIWSVVDGKLIASQSSANLCPGMRSPYALSFSSDSRFLLYSTPVSPFSPFGCLNSKL